MMDIVTPPRISTKEDWFELARGVLRDPKSSDEARLHALEKLSQSFAVEDIDLVRSWRHHFWRKVGSEVREPQLECNRFPPLRSQAEMDGKKDEALPAIGYMAAACFGALCFIAGSLAHAIAPVM